MHHEGVYSTFMPTAEIQREIISALRNAQSALSMPALVQIIQRNTSQPATTIRAAVLPLISVRRIELTPERKLRLR